MAASKRIERERQLIRAAVLLVARGESERVTVTGLRHGARILADGGPTGPTTGVRARLDPGAGPAHSIVVEAEPA